MENIDFCPIASKREISRKDMPFPYRSYRCFMKNTFSKWFSLSRRRPRCCYSHHLLRQSTWRTPCGLSSGNFQVVFLDFLRWNCMHTKDEGYITSGDGEKRRESHVNASCKVFFLDPLSPYSCFTLCLTVQENSP